MLCEQGASTSIEAQCVLGDVVHCEARTPLVTAAASGNSAVVRYLLDRNAANSETDEAGGSSC